MRRAGREGFAFACGRPDAQNGGDNVDVGEEDQEECAKAMQECRADHNSHIGGDIRAGQRKEGGQLTAIVWNGVGFTEVHRYSWKNIDDCIQKTQAP